jgi:radical SAM superfamily enzyme YgiQ (UPF0313 family)
LLLIISICDGQEIVKIGLLTGTSNNVDKIITKIKGVVSMDKLDVFFVQPSGENWKGEVEKQGKIHGIGQSTSTSDGYEIALLSEVCNQAGIASDYMVHRPDVADRNALIDLAKKIVGKSPKIVGIEAMTCYSNNAILLSQEIKALNSNISIIAGGYHPSGYPEMLYDAGWTIDYVVLGVGEIVVPKLIKEILSGESKIFASRKRFQLPQGRFDGSFSYKVNKELDQFVQKAAIGYIADGVIQLVERTREDLIDDYNDIPIPRRKLHIHKQVVCGRLTYPLPNDQITATLQITKGCPHNCSYCQSSNIFGVGGNKLVADTNLSCRTRKVENVTKELEYLSDLGVNFVFLTDLTTNSSGEYLRELSQEIVKSKRRGKINKELCFYCMFRPHTPAQQEKLGLDINIYKDMKAMGVIRIGFGIEFLTNTKLDHYKRNYKTTDVYKHLVAASDAGIFTRGLSMYSTPEDTLEMFEEYPERMNSLPVDIWRMGVVTPYLGTIYGNREFRRIYSQLNLPDDFDDFNSNTLITLPDDKRLSEKKLYDIRKYILKTVYSGIDWQTRIFNKGMNFPELQVSIEYFLDILLNQGFIDKKPNIFAKFRSKSVLLSNIA